MGITVAPRGNALCRWGSVGLGGPCIRGFGWGWSRTRLCLALELPAVAADTLSPSPTGGAAQGPARSGAWRSLLAPAVLVLFLLRWSVSLSALLRRSGWRAEVGRVCRIHRRSLVSLGPCSARCPSSRLGSYVPGGLRQPVTEGVFLSGVSRQGVCAYVAGSLRVAVWSSRHRMGPNSVRRTVLDGKALLGKGLNRAHLL